MTLYEWKITKLCDGKFGYLWISEPSRTTDHMHVWIDPANVFAHYDQLIVGAYSNVLANCEEPPMWWNGEGSATYERIISYWRTIGSPVTDRKAVDYQAPWFQWLEAGFSGTEVALLRRASHTEIIIGNIPASTLESDEDARFEKAAEAAVELESE